MDKLLLIDIGSTFTKATLVDVKNAQIIGRSQAITTVDTNILEGLMSSLDGLDRWREADRKLACSSAAGGLQIVAIGMVPDLTAEAARRAALSAGGRVIETFSYELTEEDIKNILRSDCDIILLSGGTDGGNKDVILHNASKIAESGIKTPVIVAGNRSVAPEAAKILQDSGKKAYITENVMPRLDELNITPVQSLIRKIFLENIIKARGLNKVSELIDGIVMPTPSAVLKAARVLAEGAGDEPGLGELIVIDIGGATTDIHSIASGKPSEANVSCQGLEEPYCKRTVEADMGMRYGAPSLEHKEKDEGISKHIFKPENSDGDTDELQKYLRKVYKQVDYLPNDKNELLMESHMARNAARVAMSRHAGTLTTVYTPMGHACVQKGKDLSTVEHVIGTGGVVVNNDQPGFILSGTLHSQQQDPQKLTPVDPGFLIDKKYILAAAGLMAEAMPEQAVKLMKKYLLPVGKRK